MIKSGEVLIFGFSVDFGSHGCDLAMYSNR